ncbi:alpha-2-macroglobulin family protein [Sulfitobacter sp. LCG007]
MRLLISVLTFLLAPVFPVLSQVAVPQDRFVLSRDMDFYGADLTNLFDTSLEACERACAAQSACVAFTFNTRNNACFPKSAVSERQVYAGAVSGLRRATAPDVLAQASQRADEVGFVGPQTLEAAATLVQRNADRAPVSGQTPSELATAAEAALEGGRQAEALGYLQQAIALGDSAEFWLAYSELVLRLRDDVPDRNTLRDEAVPAAVNAYLRTGVAALRAAALMSLSDALQAQGRGRDAIPALRLTQDIAPGEDVARALDDAIAKFGFRVVDNSVESDAARPRICVEFSEALAGAGVDYEPFLRLDEPDLVVATEDRQLCLDGVAHGRRYEFTLRSGLPAASGETLNRDVALALYVRDRSPSVRFPGRAYVLPRSGDAALPVETVNLDSVELALRRVSDRNLLRAIQDSYFGRPLSEYEDTAFATEIAEEIWTGSGQVGNELNADMTTRLPLGDILSDLPAGIYALSARVPGADPYETPGATQWFVLSDIGLQSWEGTDGLTVAARSLADASALEGVGLTLVSRANAVLAEARTDAEGFAHFEAGFTRGEGASAPALLIAERGDEDIAFLSLADPAFDLSDRGVEGRPPAPPIDAFLATDRGAYRAGETVHATALIRDDRGVALDGLPLMAVLRRPDGVEYSRALARDGADGGYVFALQVGADAPRGAWRLELFGDLDATALASERVLVEDFLPERLDFDIALPETPQRLGEATPIRVEARYLFGAPAAELPVEGELRLQANRSLPAFPGYFFGRHDEPFYSRSATLAPTRTDAEGQVVIEAVWPEAGAVEVPLEAEIVLRVSEGSGRPVERRALLPLVAEGALIGIRPLFDDVLPEGGTAAFELVSTGDAPIPAHWTLNRVETRYQWYQMQGNWNWEPTTRRIRMAEGDVTLSGTPQALDLPTEWGGYELIVERADGSYTVSSQGFSSGWYGGADSSATPDRLDMSLDSETYAPGDTARLRIVTEAAGTAMVMVLSNRLIARQVVEVAAGETLLPLEVGEDWGAGAYVTVSVLRGLADATGRTPVRALGLAYAKVAPGDRALDVSIETPAQIDGQEGSFLANVSVTGARPGETAYLTLAAVDVGILNLTGFEAPDPQAHYFGQQRLGVELRDLYGRLIDSRNGALGQIRSGGDANAGAGLQSPPPTERLMAFFSGLVTVGPDGRAGIVIDKPAFNGTIRLMALAWTSNAVGAASREVIARDPVVVTASLPRFLAPGDESRLLLELTGQDAPGEVSLSLTATGLGVDAVPETVMLGPEGTARMDIPLRAGEEGDHEIRLDLRAPDGTRLTRSLRVPVRRNDPELAITRRFTLGPGATFVFDDNLLEGFHPGSALATLSVGPLARFDVPGLLRQLDRYPYGCTEQLASSALPLLYLGELAPGAGVQDPQGKVRSAIRRILTRQSGNGAFGLWEAGSGNFWLDAYVTDFLSQARQAGYDLPDIAFRQAIDNLRNRVNYAPDFDSGGEDVAYALLVLARDGAARIGDLRYYADTRADAFATPLSAAQLGAALASYGDQVRADAMFARAGTLLARQDDPRGYREDFGTALRDRAAVLRLAAEAGSDALDLAALSGGLVGRRALSTQEAAQVLLASHALDGTDSGPGITLDGVAASGPVIARRSAGDAAPLIRNTGYSEVDVTVTSFGTPEAPGPADGYGYAISRDYLDLDGNPAGDTLRPGDRLVAVLTVTPFEETGARLIVDDALPAGLEIDNPNLLRAGDIAALDWLETAEPEHAEFRSDRFIAALDHFGSDPFRLAYMVRAVSPGRFHHPAALVQDMYRPEYRAVTATGRLAVRE